MKITSNTGFGGHIGAKKNAAWPARVIVGIVLMLPLHVFTVVTAHSRRKIRMRMIIRSASERTYNLPLQYVLELYLSKSNSEFLAITVVL